MLIKRLFLLQPLTIGILLLSVLSVPVQASYSVDDFGCIVKAWYGDLDSKPETKCHDGCRAYTKDPHYGEFSQLEDSCRSCMQDCCDYFCPEDLPNQSMRQICIKKGIQWCKPTTSKPSSSETSATSASSMMSSSSSSVHEEAPSGILTPGTSAHPTPQ